MSHLPPQLDASQEPLYVPTWAAFPHFNCRSLALSKSFWLKPKNGQLAWVHLISIELHHNDKRHVGCRRSASRPNAHHLHFLDRL